MADYGTFHHGIVIGIIRDDFQSSRKRNDLGESTDFIRDGCGVGRIHSALEPELFVKFAKDEFAGDGEATGFTSGLDGAVRISHPAHCGEENVGIEDDPVNRIHGS